MEHPGEQYYKLNRRILLATGLWPYQKKWIAYLMRIIIIVVLVSATIFQMSSFFVFDVTVDLVMTVLIEVLPTMGSLNNLIARIQNADKLRNLFDHMWNDWRLRKKHYEVKILRKRAKITKLVTLYYILIQYTLVIVYNSVLFTPDILDIILPMNESRSRRFPFIAYFFIDEEEHFNLIRLHACIVIIVFPLIFIVTSTIFMLFAQHVAGMCELLGYYAEHLFCAVKNTTHCNLTRSNINRENTIFFIRLHYNVIQFVFLWKTFTEMLEFYHTVPFLMDFLGIALLTSVALTQILLITNGVDLERLFRSVCVVTVSLGYLFTINYMGQVIMNATSNVYDKAYNSAWYQADIYNQKSVLLIMKRRVHPLVLTACKFTTISLQNFGAVLHTVLSYCMFMRQL